VLVDGEPLGGPRLDRLRARTAWVDPAVQLWNRSLLENLEFGQSVGNGVPVGTRIVEAQLRGLVERLPQGLQTSLGEGGTLVSGGEGQRVRFGRGLGRPDARLAILDEPFRGLEREKRADLLQKARERWRHATLVCVTHDIGETASFDRVVVMAQGRIVEDGRPADLAARPGSRYRWQLDAESAVRDRLWTNPTWRTIRLEGGTILQKPQESAPPAEEPRRVAESDRPRPRRLTV
jgi:ATP-binding cassette subfamily B protein